MELFLPPPPPPGVTTEPNALPYVPMGSTLLLSRDQEAQHRGGVTGEAPVEGSRQDAAEV